MAISLESFGVDKLPVLIDKIPVLIDKLPVLTQEVKPKQTPFDPNAPRMSVLPAGSMSILQNQTQAVNKNTANLSVPSGNQLNYPQQNTSIDNSQAILAGIQKTLDLWTQQLKQAQSQQDVSTEKPEALKNAESEQSSIFQKIKDKSAELLGIGERKTELETQYGVDENIKKLQENQLAIASRLEEYNNAIKQIDSSDKLKPFADIERSRAARTYALEVGALEAYGNALRGNLQLAEDRISQVLQNEFQATQQEIDNLKTFYEINKDILSSEERKYINDIQTRANLMEEELKQKQLDAKNNRDLFLEVVKNGGSANVVDFNLPYEENLERAAPYVGALERERLALSKRAEERLSTTSEDDSVGVFDDLIKTFVASGIPTEGILEGVSRAALDNFGITLSLKDLDKVRERVNQISGGILQTQVPSAEQEEEVGFFGRLFGK